MQAITEPGSQAELAALDEAWASQRSLLVLPRKSPVGPEWLSRMLDALPGDLAHGHFGLLTSGSTGAPKLVIGEKARSTELTRRIHERQDLAGVRTAVLALPLSYSYSFVNQWLWSRTHGTQLLMTKGLSDPLDLLQALAGADAPAMLCLVGSQLPLLRQAVRPGQNFPAVTRLNFAGGAFPQHELPWLASLFPNALVFNNYGCTEALPRLCIRPATQSADPANIGSPLEGVELRSGADSALEFRSPYGAVAVTSAEGFHRIAPEEWLPTGDLGVPVEDGTWRLLGRGSEVFKRYGEKISLPLLLETVRGAWQGEASFYIDRNAPGETAHVLVLSPAPQPNQLRDVLLAFRARHRRPHWPVRIEALDSMPLLPNGKPDGRALQQGAGQTVAWRQIG